MSLARWDNVRRLFLAAGAREGSDRGRFLDEACEGDLELRREVDSLLDADAQAGRFMEAPALELAAKQLILEQEYRLVGRQLDEFMMLSVLGRGGMGDVYRARDTKLGREVAIKVLPEGLSQKRQRLARFEREAQLLASLNHPGIATLYGSEECDGIQYLVMELVEGETLRERIARKPLSTAEALSFFQQLAEALEAAHAKGVVHRDLKPANIKLTPDGVVKVLDFGLAKALEVAPVPGESPREGGPATEAGAVMGTAPYMSPEQARGLPTDQRTDIWAFGCVLFEALTGRAAFSGRTASDTMARILEREPDWSSLPRIPTRLEELLRRCLRKDPRRRLQHIGDARIEIEEAESGPSTPKGETTAVVRTTETTTLVLVLAAALVTGLVVWMVKRAPRDVPRPVSRFILEETAVPAMPPRVALSPDGTKLVYVGGSFDARQLFLRDMETVESVPIEGTEGADRPFFSPNGEWLGYYDYGLAKIRKASLRGGAPTNVIAAGSPRGMSWGRNGNIVYAPSYRTGLWRVGAGGEPPEALTKLDADALELSHRWPEVLPGDSAVLFTVIDGKMSSSDEARIEVLLLDSGERRIVLRGGSHPKYISTGHLVYVQSGSIFAAPFALETLDVTGPSVELVEGVPPHGDMADLAVAANGTLVYSAGGALDEQHRLTWLGPDGLESDLPVEPRFITSLRVSPDGTTVVLQIPSAFAQLWVHDVDRGATSRLNHEAEAVTPIWTPQGDHVVFSRRPGGRSALFRKPADGSGEAERLVESEFELWPVSFSPDGRVLAYTELHPETNLDIWMLEMDGDRATNPFLRTDALEAAPEFSPDGAWLAYVSDETGRPEVYVTSLRDRGKRMVSTRGGLAPSWSKSGTELFYRDGNRMMAATIGTEPPLAVSKPRVLFEKDDWARAIPDNRRYGLAPDGRFLIRRTTTQAGPAEIHVVLNWTEDLKRRVPEN